MFALLTGDIGYQATGVFPKRQHKVVQGVYAKNASKKENMWTGILTSHDLPYVVNPEKGYIVSTNNRMTSEKVDHGLSHAFSFTHRAVRISELLEGLIASDKPIRVREIQEVIADVLDVQARESLPDMLKCVQEGLSALSDSQKASITLPIEKLKSWDYQYRVNSVEASLFEAWEFMIATYMHEAKITDTRLRRSLWAIGDSQMFVFRQVSDWVSQPHTKQEYC